MSKIYMDTILDKTHVNLQTAYAWIREGKIKGTKVGNRWEFDEDEFNKFLNSDEYVGIVKEMGNTEMFRRIPNVEECYPYNLISFVLGIDDPEDRQDYFPEIDILDVNVRVFKQQVAMLHDREQKAIELRFQFGLTLDEISKVMSLTRERIRQIILKAGRKLRWKIKTGCCKMVPASEYVKMESKVRGLELTIDNLTRKEHGVKEPPIESKDVRIETLDFSVRAYNCLKRAGIDTLQEIIDFDCGQDKQWGDYRNHIWIEIRNMGRVTLKEIAKKVQEVCGYQLREFDPKQHIFVGSILETSAN